MLWGWAVTGRAAETAPRPREDSAVAESTGVWGHRPLLPVTLWKFIVAGWGPRRGRDQFYLGVRRDFRGQQMPKPCSCPLGKCRERPRALVPKGRSTWWDRLQGGGAMQLGIRSAVIRSTASVSIYQAGFPAQGGCNIPSQTRNFSDHRGRDVGTFPCA